MDREVCIPSSYVGSRRVKTTTMCYICMEIRALKHAIIDSELCAPLRKYKTLHMRDINFSLQYRPKYFHGMKFHLHRQTSAPQAIRRRQICHHRLRVSFPVPDPSPKPYARPFLISKEQSRVMTGLWSLY